jgi:hypothetical protein
MEFKDFFDMVKGVDEYNVYRPKLGTDDFDAFYPPYFPDKYIGSQIDEVFMKTVDDCWVIAVVYLK